MQRLLRIWCTAKEKGVSLLYAAPVLIFKPLADAKSAPILERVYQSQGIGDFVNTLFMTALSIGAILAVLRLAYAGYVYMGSELWTSKEHAKEIIRNTFLGLLLLLSIYIILDQINPDIVSLKAFQNITPLSGSSGGATLYPK